MPFYEREEKILNILLESQTISNNELAKKLFISIPTLRRDLEKLERKGLIVRSHGACSLNKQAPDQKIPIYYREHNQNSAKIKMAKKAVEFIKDNDVIMMDASTSAYTMLPLLRGFDNLVVITSGAKTSCALGALSINNISTGGQMITKSLSYIGKEAIDTIRRYYADVVFFSCRGLANDGRLTDTSIEENDVRREMLLHARKKVFLCDSSKIGRSCFSTLCHLSDVDEIVCDEPLPEHILKLMK